jgi:acetolactate synthase I/II/III large subunit
MNNADLIVQMLKAAGIERGFGVPSGNVLPFMEAMRSGGIDFVLTTHEAGAGFAATVTGRMTGRPGLCIATLGPGATNLATGVGCAFLDRSPLIAVTCTLNEAQLGRRLQMWIDHHSLFRPITKASFRLKHGAIAATVAEALRIALTEPPGPVHLDLPEDVALRDADERPAAPALGAAAPAAGEAAIAAATRMLATAQRPVVVVGATALRMKEPDLLRAFVERHHIPFATTTMAKGLIDDEHPLALGCIERARRQLQRSFVRGSDLVIGIGYDTIEVEYEAWLGDRPLVHVDTEAADVDSTVKLACEVVGDLDASVRRLTAIPPQRNEWPPDMAGEHRTIFQRELRPPAAAFSPHEVIDTVRGVLPAHGVLCFDVGAHTHQIAAQWPARRPGTFVVTNGWSSMGFGIPAAIAAKLARPDLPVVCILGDACFRMTCGELVVAERQRLAIPIVVLNDGWLSLIKVKQERRGLEVYGTRLDPAAQQTPPHYFGVPAIAAGDANVLERELRKALAAGGPTVIEAAIDPSEYSLTVYD